MIFLVFADRIVKAGGIVPGKNPSFRPYPKPTLVDRLSIPRRVRKLC